MSENCVGYSTLTVTSVAQTMATACSPPMPSQAHGAVITVETDQVRYRADGTAPTTTEGTLLNVGDVRSFDSWTVPQENWKSVLKALQFIYVTSNAALKIEWYD